MNLDPIIQSEVSQKERREKKTILYINAYIWNLERWYQRTHLQGSNGDADTENRLVDTGQVRESGTNGESSTETYTLPYVK